MPVRLLIVTNFFPPHTVGGAEIVAYRQARALLARGHKVTVLAGATPTETKPEGYLDLDTYDELPVYRLSIRSLDADQNFYWPAAARRLRSIIAADRIEVVHVHNAMGIGANVIPAAVEAGARCFVTLHDHWGFCLRATLLRKNGELCTNFEECAQCLDAIRPPNDVALPTRLRRDYIAWCLDQADLLIAPSKYLASAYTSAGFPADSIAVISNGIDLGALSVGPRRSISKSLVNFFCSAYLGEHKGIIELLEALKLLSKDSGISSRWHLTVAGDGPLRERIEQTLRQAGLKDNVALTGRVARKHLLALLPQMDVAVLPSIWPENEPVSMLEAIASGMAQIATRLGGSPELVENGQSGFLVTPGNPRELAAAMRTYIQDPSLAAAHGEFNLMRRQRFDELNSVQQLETAFANVRASHERRPATGPTVICGGGWPPLAVTRLMDNAYKHLGDGPRPRFIWHGWADTSIWRDAKLLWLWDRHPEEAMTTLAFRHRVPVLAPRSGWTEGLARHFDAIILYDKYIEALAAMRALFKVPTLLAKFASSSQAASNAAIAMAPTTASDLPSERSD